MKRRKLEVIYFSNKSNKKFLIPESGFLLISSMRLLNRYIQKELFLPFIFSLLVIVFILFTNFFLRALDRFLGKGLDLPTILEYLVLNLAWIVSLAVPMAVLIATLMSFGRMSEDNEIIAMRASGISSLTVIRSALIFGTLVGTALVLFNNFIQPDMNFRARLLSGDIYRKRPGMIIEPGHFIDDLPGYSMIIRGKKGEIFEDVRIFSKANKESQTSIQSKTGSLSATDDAIILNLYDGEIHELDLKGYEHYRRIEFKKHVITLPADDLLLSRRDSSSRTAREMTVPMMVAKQKLYTQRINVVKKRLAKSFKRTIGDSIFYKNPKLALSVIQQEHVRVEKDSLLNPAQVRVKKRKLRTLENQVKNEFNLINSYVRSQNKYGVEIHKKFSLPFACILFVLLGTSLGILAKKGGFVVGISLSFGFFLMYYLFMIGGKDMAIRNLVTPAIGLWTPNVILLIISLYLTFYTIRERTPLRINWPELNIRKLFKQKK